MIRAAKYSKVSLHLSKPWELGEALGWPSLAARVARQQADRWLVELEHPIHHAGTEYRYFVLSPRLDGWQLGDATALEVSCSMTPLSSEKTASQHLSDVALREDIVGSVTDYVDAHRAGERDVEDRWLSDDEQSAESAFA